MASIIIDTIVVAVQAALDLQVASVTLGAALDAGVVVVAFGGVIAWGKPLVEGILGKASK